MKNQSETQTQASVAITAPLGLHARPAARLVKLAQQFDCTTTISSNGTSADAQSILDLLTLSASQGSTVVVFCEGKDAPQACEQITRFLQTEMGDQPDG